jgi:hypothetical protein
MNATGKFVTKRWIANMDLIAKTPKNIHIITSDLNSPRRTLHPRCNGESIDLLVLPCLEYSSFEKLRKISQSVDCKNIILPFCSVEEKLLLILQQTNRQSKLLNTEYARFLFNPYKWMIESGVKPESIEFIAKNSSSHRFEQHSGGKIHKTMERTFPDWIVTRGNVCRRWEKELEYCISYHPSLSNQSIHWLQKTFALLDMNIWETFHQYLRKCTESKSFLRRLGDDCQHWQGPKIHVLISYTACISRNFHKREAS